MQISLQSVGRELRQAVDEIWQQSPEKRLTAGPGSSQEGYTVASILAEKPVMTGLEELCVTLISE